MRTTSLHDLRNLAVLVLHPDNAEGTFLLSHLRRIGCNPSRMWPIPERLPDLVDVVFLAIEDDARQEIMHFVKNIGDDSPTILAIVSYENPSALQVVLESGAKGIIERPIKPFGLLTNLAIARNNWEIQRNLQKDARKYKRKVMGERILNRAKLIVMAKTGCSEAEAHDDIRKKSMAQRVTMEDAAMNIINAEGDLPKLRRRV